MSTKILIVEDSPTQAARLKHLLQQNNFEVLVAGRATEALDTARQQRPDLMISDVNMPEMDGFELCRRVRLDPQLRELAILLLTGLSDPEDIIRGLDSGADCYLTKPYEESELASRIDFVLSNRISQRNDETPLDVTFLGKTHSISASRQQILGLLLSTYESAAQQNRRLNRDVLSMKMLQRELQSKYKTLESQTKELPAALRTLFMESRVPVLVVARAGELIELNESARLTFGVGGSSFVSALGDHHRTAWNGLTIHWSDPDQGELRGELQVLPVSWNEENCYLVTVQPHKPIRELQSHNHNLSRQNRVEFLGHISQQLGEVIAPLQECREALDSRTLGALQRLENMDIFRLGALQWLIKPTMGDVGELVEDCLHSFGLQTLARERQVQLSYQRDTDPGQWEVDRPLVAEAIFQLVKNAIQHSPPNSDVQVSVHPRPESIEISVSDCGPGVLTQLVPDLFQLSVAGPGGGIGRGLYYVRCVAEAHGGSATYRAKQAGSLFTLQLPRSVEGRN